MITVKVDVRKALAGIDALQTRQVPFALALALTRTARSLAREVAQVMPSELDRPRPSTRRATRVEPATKERLQATMRFTEPGEGVPAAQFLGPNITGGLAALKRSEIMLQAAGILPAGLVTIPGAAARLDAYGNMSRGQIVSILSYFRTFGRTALNSGRMNRARRGSRGRFKYFVARPGDRLPAGIDAAIWTLLLTVLARRHGSTEQ